MTTANCRACGHEVSTRAALCPQCGDSDPARTGTKGGLVLLGMLIAAVVFAWFLPSLVF